MSTRENARGGWLSFYLECLSTYVLTEFESIPWCTGTTVTAILKAMMTFILQLLEVLAILIYGMVVGTLCCIPTVPPDR